MPSSQPCLFIVRDDPDSRKAKALLSKNRISFRIVDLVKSDALAFIERDIGVKSLPFLVTDRSKYEGLAQIKRFTSSRR